MLKIEAIALGGILLAVLYVTGEKNDGHAYEKTFLEGLLTSSPAFAASGKNLSPQCLADSKEFLRDLKQLKYWAFQMYDSSGKPNSGMLNGNLNGYGDFDQCLSISHPRIKGKYCLMGFDIDFHPNSSYDGNLRELVTSAYVDRLWYGENHNDPEKKGAPMKKLLWGFCVPSSCDVEDLQSTLKHSLAPFNSTDNGLQINVIPMEGSCTTDVSRSFTGRTYFVLFLLLKILSLVMFSTLYDWYRQSPTGEIVDVHTLSIPAKIALAFSLKRTLPMLLHFQSKNDSAEIMCVHGIRFIYAIQIYFGHKILFTFFYPVTNKTSTIRQLLGSQLSMIFGATLNSIDTFVLMSGLLVAFNGFQQLNSGRTFNIRLMYMRRYAKFMPLYIILVLMIRDFFPYVLRNQHNISILDERMEHCRSIIKPLTFTGNMDSLDGMCHPVSHQVVTDMQMYLLSPFIIVFLWKYKSAAVKTILLVVAGLCLNSGWVIYSKKLVSVAYHGIAFTLAVESADHMYLNILHRLPPYLIGIVLGYVLQCTKSHPIKLTMFQQILGHITASIAAYYSYFWMTHCAKPSYQYDALEMATYKAVHPFMWGFVLSWLIFVCYTGHAKILNAALSLRPFVFFSRIAYAFYMYQTVDMVMNLQVQRLPTYLHPLSVIDPGLLLRIVLESTVLTLVFCLPPILVEKHLRTPIDKSK